MSDASPGNAAPTLPTLMDAGRYEDVLVQTILAVQNGSAGPEMLSLLASVMLNTGWSAMPAVAALEKMLAADPDHVLALLNLGLIFYDTDQVTAWRYLSRFFALAGEGFPGNSRIEVVKVSPVVDFAAWRAGQDVRELEPAQEVTVTDSLGGAQHSYYSDAILAVAIPGAMVITGWDYVILPGGEVLGGCSYMDIGLRFNGVSHIYSRESRRAVHPWPRGIIKTDEDVVFLSAPAGHHFGHWIADFLPRLRAWRRPLKVAVPRDITQHQRDTLAMFGVREEDIFWCETGRRYRFRSVTVVRKDDMYRPNPAAARFLYDALGPDPATAPKRAVIGKYFYLERSGTQRGRYVANQEELAALLGEYGFAWMRRPEVAVPDQNELLQDAGIVLTVFGTDVFALYQLRPGTDLVALYPDTEKELGVRLGTLAITSVCATLGIRLHRVLCRVDQKAGVKDVYRQDLIVDCQALQECLDEIIERRSLAYAASWESST